MTPEQYGTEIAAWGALAVAVVNTAVQTYAQIRTTIKTALHDEKIDNNTARLNGQSAKIDTLLIATPPTNYPTATAVVGKDGQTTVTAGESPPAGPAPPVGATAAQPWLFPTPTDTTTPTTEKPKP